VRKEKPSQAEQIRRLKLAVAGEDKYFPGILGSPVAFAARWGLSLSKDRRSKTKLACLPSPQPDKSLSRKTGPALSVRLKPVDPSASLLAKAARRTGAPKTGQILPDTRPHGFRTAYQSSRHPVTKD
jgi:hypothetical protein